MFNSCNCIMETKGPYSVGKNHHRRLGSIYFYTFPPLFGMPDAVQKKVNAAIYKFIWNRTDKIKRAVLNSNYCDGGLKMINLKARIRTQKLMWIKRNISPIESGWKSILNHYLSAVGGPSFLKCNVNMSKVSIDIQYCLFIHNCRCWVILQMSTPLLWMRYLTK